MIVQLATTPKMEEGEAVPLRYVVPPDAPVELWDSGTPLLARSGDTLQKIAGFITCRCGRSPKSISCRKLHR